MIGCWRLQKAAPCPASERALSSVHHQHCRSALCYYRDCACVMCTTSIISYSGLLVLLVRAMQSAPCRTAHWQLLHADPSHSAYGLQGYSVNLHVHRLQHIISAAIRIQSPATRPDELQARVASWLVALRGQLESMDPAELSNHKRVSAIHMRRRVMCTPH